MPILFFKAPKEIWLVEKVLPGALRRVFTRLLIFSAALFLALTLVYGGGILFGLFLIALAFLLVMVLINFFVVDYLEKPISKISLKEFALRASQKPLNFADVCDIEVIRAFGFWIGAWTLQKALISLLGHQSARKIFARLGLRVKDALDFLGGSNPTPLNPDELSGIFGLALGLALKRDANSVSFADTLIAFAGSSTPFQQFLFDNSLSLQDFETVARWREREEKIKVKRKSFWSRENLFAIKPFGRSWAFGYTPLLDKYSQELWGGGNISSGSELRELFSLDEVKRVENALSKVKGANALLIGELGVGVSEIISIFAKRVYEGASLPFLNHRRVARVNFGEVLGGLKTTGEIEERVRGILKETRSAGGLILVVENIHTILGAEKGGLEVDLSADLSDILKEEGIEVVATTTPKGLHEVLEKREAFLDLFDKIEIEEPDEEQTLQMLLDAVPKFEARFRVFVPYPALKALTVNVSRAIKDVPFPKKAFDALESILIEAIQGGVKVLTPDYVVGFISERTKIPLGALTSSERDKLLKLEEVLHKRIVGQDEALSAISNALRRARSGIRGAAEKRPLGTFIFLGPTGVGKTETAKALAAAYFGSEDRMIRLDMSEFQGVDAVDYLIGSPAKREEGRLASAVHENPFSLILLDEFEKINLKALDLFLPIFDEGVIKDGWGREISFTNTIIIATSNAAAEFVREYISEGKDEKELPKVLREEVLREELFKPELINRFDGFIVFKPLTRDEVFQIAGLLINKLSSSVLKEQGIELKIDSEVVDMVISKGYSQEFGARELRRVIQDSIENAAAKKVLQTQAKRGDVIEITLADIQPF